MGALEDYYNYIQKMDPNLKIQLKAYGSFLPGVLGQLSQASIAADIGNAYNEEFASKPQTVQQPVQQIPRDDFYIYPEDQARKAAIQAQLQAGTQSPYGLGTANFAGGQTPVGQINQVAPAVSEYLSQFGAPQQQPLGPPVPQGFQYQQPTVPQPEPQAVAGIGQLQEPPAPQIPAGWTPSQAPQEALSQETLAALTPQERFAVSQGYAPEKAQGVQGAVNFAQPLDFAPAQETASPLIPARQSQQPAPRRIEAPPAVNAAFEEMLKNAPKELQSQFRAIRAATDQRAIARREAAAQAMQQFENYRIAKHRAIDEGVQIAEKEGLTAYGKTQHDIARDRAMTEKEYELAQAQLQAQGMDPTAAADFLKNAKENINDKYKDAIKPFEETDQYKRAMNSLDSMGKEIRDHNNLVSQIDQLKEYLDNGKIDEANRYAKSTVAQTVNSLRNQNAIQTTEMLIRYADLLDPQTRASLTGKWMGPDLLAKLIQGTLSAKDKEEAGKRAKQNPEGIKELLGEAIRAKPENFLQTTIDTSNANAASLNQALTDFVIRPTSQKLAKVELFQMTPNYVMPKPQNPSALSPKAQEIINRFKTKQNL